MTVIRTMGHSAAVATMLILAIACVGCTTTPPPEDTYVTDYHVVDERTIKYLYLTGEPSRAGSSHPDQGLAIEVCSVGEDDDSVESDCQRTRVLKTEEYR